MKIKYADYLQRTFLTKEELLAYSLGNLLLDPPKEGAGILPSPPLLMIDRVTEIVRMGNKGRIVGEQEIHLDAWFFQCHFRNDPVQPGCLGIDAIWQLIGLYLSLCGSKGYGRALGVKEIEFFGQIRPHNHLVRYEVDIRRYLPCHTTGTSFAIGSAIIFVDDEPIYTVKDAKVGGFIDIAYSEYPHLSKNAIGKGRGKKQGNHEEIGFVFS